MLLTSGELTSEYINKISKNKLKIFHIGGKRHHSIYKNMIYEKKISIEMQNIAHSNLIVCTEPFNPSRDQLSDYESMLTAGIDKELTLLCANPDFVVDVGETREMCAGSVASMYEQMGGKVIYFGKPYPEVYNQSINNKNKKILSIGDNLNTDIKGANLLNFDSMIISNGIHKNEIKEKGIEEISKSYETICNYMQSELKW